MRITEIANVLNIAKTEGEDSIVIKIDGKEVATATQATNVPKVTGTSASDAITAINAVIDALVEAGVMRAE